MIFQKCSESGTIFTHWFFEFGDPIHFAERPRGFNQTSEFMFCQVDVPIDGMTVFEEGVSIEILWGWVHDPMEWWVL